METETNLKMKEIIENNGAMVVFLTIAGMHNQKMNG